MFHPHIVQTYIDETYEQSLFEVFKELNYPKVQTLITQLY